MKMKEKEEEFLDSETDRDAKSIVAMNSNNGEIQGQLEVAFEIVILVLDLVF